MNTLQTILDKIKVYENIDILKISKKKIAQNSLKT